MGKKMHVAVWYNNRDIRIETVPVPEIGPGELLVKIESSGICGSDVMEWYRISRAPLVLGHEIAGEVVKVGEGVTGFHTGDRVIAAHHVPCNTCHYCLTGHQTVCETLRRTNFYPGGFAEYVRLPAINVDRGTFLLPGKMTYDEATFVEPLACVLRGQRIAGVTPGLSVLVIGSGIAGLLHIMLARAMGAGCIMATDINDYRLAAARKFGANAAFHANEDIPTQVRGVNNGRLADIVVVCTGAKSAFLQTLACVDRGGTVLIFATPSNDVTIPLNINELFWRTDMTLTTSYAGSPADHVAAMEMIAGGGLPIAGMITHRLGLAETGIGFKLVSEASECIKVIIHPHK